ncbi:Hypothetical protein HDN1F_33260 [gamma proteobacterium HdN1]|nr:Hypothetical protein HDN1F_33260 [gamma proteobacterium HdN1]
MPVITPYYCALMFERVLPDTVKPYKLARQGAELNGLLPLSDFHNLVQGTLFEEIQAPADGAQERANVGPAGIQSQDAAQHGVVKVQLRFENGANGVALVTGQLEATVAFQCQRCLEPVPTPLKAEVCIVVFDPEIVEEDDLPDGYEPMPISGEQAQLVELIEQELILAAPLVPRHDDCKLVVKASADSAQIAKGEEQTASELSQTSPFAGLAAMLTHADKAKPLGKAKDPKKDEK